MSPFTASGLNKKKISLNYPQYPLYLELCVAAFYRLQIEFLVHEFRTANWLILYS